MKRPVLLAFCLAVLAALGPLAGRAEAAAVAPQVLLWDNDNGRTFCDPDILASCFQVGTETGLVRSLQANGVDVVVVTQLPTSLVELLRYDAVYVDLGWRERDFPAGQVTDSEQRLLHDYIFVGKPVYLEGNDFAFDYPNSILLADFGASFNNDGNPPDQGTVQTLHGVAGTITDGMTFPYEYQKGPDTYPDDILPLPFTRATVILNASPGKAVSYPTESGAGPGQIRGATVYLSVVFGAMSDGEFPSTKKEFQRRNLGYFGIQPTGVTEETTWGHIKALWR